ncbi:MAG: ADP-ribosylglycohydrolase family protein [Lachnospiraceae bacterium]|nr:ADP-ribosylglycohydrolase family protein [Lachnospiraceae bacterium]
MRKISYSQYLDKVTGCFIGKAISGNIGAPHEGVKMPMELPFMPEMINPDLPNDDLDLQVLWLDVLEEKGEHFTSYDLLERFVKCTPYSPGEYAVMRKNFERGIFPPYSGSFCNDYYIEGMGCPIRSEIWGCVAVGNATLARELSSRDGVLDHKGESVEAEMFLAALESEAFFESDVHKLIDKALAYIPENSKFRRLAEDVVEWCDIYGDSKEVFTQILFHYGHPDCTNMFQNMGITLLSLLLGDSEIIKTSLMALNCGFDTDCTCATAGAIIGILRGAEELIEAYGLKKITYTLGVESNRRSDLIVDLAEDIAAMGIYFSKNINAEVEITDAPAVAYSFPPLKAYDVAVDYEDSQPVVELGKSRKITLTLKNNTDADQVLSCKLTAEHGLVCDTADFCCEVKAGSEVKVPVTVSLPMDTEIVYDRNLLTLTAADESGREVLHHVFGIAGATPWKLSGPFWRTEPVSDTEKILEHFQDKTPYAYLMQYSQIPGNGIDKLRHFHLNFATDTETEYLPQEEWGKALNPDRRSTKYCEKLVSTPQDSFEMKDFFGFQGPCAAYLTRVVVAEEERECCMQIGYSSPFALYLNGEKLAFRDNCENWTAENVHLEQVKLKKGENLLMFRMTRINADAKYNINFSVGIACDAHIVTLGSKNPYRF